MEIGNRPRNPLLQPAFVICVTVLTLAGAGMSVMTRALGVYLKKDPLPLRKPLSEISDRELAPYKVLAKLPIGNRQVLESLGTEDYIQWVLEDPCEPPAGPARRLLLFITYYGVPDRVPHVPEECYTGAGYDCLSKAQVNFNVNAVNHGRSVPGRFLLFRSPGNRLDLQAGQFPVMYLFRINQEYAGDRDEARMALNRGLFSKYAYFSKIELAFNQASGVPTKEEAIAAGERLLRVLLPLLEREYWPAPPSAADEVGKGE